MKRRTVVLCICLVSVCLLASCGGVLAGRRIVLPEAGDVRKITVNGGMTVRETEDAGDIAELLQKMGLALNTGDISIHDRPLANDVLQIDFEFRQGGTSTVFLYHERGEVLLEQPYEGIYRADAGSLDFLWE